MASKARARKSTPHQLKVKRVYYERNRKSILANLRKKRDEERGGPPRPYRPWTRHTERRA